MSQLHHLFLFQILFFMRKLLLLFALLFVQQSFAQNTECIVTTSYTFAYQSTSNGNCTFLFTPTVTVNQSGASVKLARYTFEAGGQTVTVCYSGMPVAITNCDGPFTALPGGAGQVLPTATVVLPCGSGNLVLTGSTSTQGISTCTNQVIFDGPLPVKLISFTGASKADGVHLNWATEWESQNEGFDVQKSANASSFEGIGSVKGHATTNELSTYAFVDQDVRAGQTYYYRLKQKDVSGAFAYSKILAVRHTLGQDAPAKVFPNANTGGSFMLSMPEAQSATISLYTTAGVEIPVSVTKTGDPNLVSVSAKSSLSKGIYLLKAISADGAAKQALNVLVQ